MTGTIVAGALIKVNSVQTVLAFSKLQTKLGWLLLTLKLSVLMLRVYKGIKREKKYSIGGRKKKANVLLLQETHSTPEVIEKWNSQWGGETYYSHGNTESRGVAIFIDKHFDYTVNACHRDKEGRYVILDLEVYHQRTIIVNVYAPNQDDPSFFINVLAKLEDIGCENVIWGGILILSSKLIWTKRVEQSRLILNVERWF